MSPQPLRRQPAPSPPLAWDFQVTQHAPAPVSEMQHIVPYILLPFQGPAGAQEIEMLLHETKTILPSAPAWHSFIHPSVHSLVRSVHLLSAAPLCQPWAGRSRGHSLVWETELTTLMPHNSRGWDGEVQRVVGTQTEPGELGRSGRALGGDQTMSGKELCREQGRGGKNSPFREA